MNAPVIPEEKRGLLSGNKSLWIYLHQLRETIVLRNLCDNLFSSLSNVFSLTDDNKIQWNYLWALTCTAVSAFFMSWFFFLFFQHSHLFSMLFSSTWVWCQGNRASKTKAILVGDTKCIICICSRLCTVCMYRHILRIRRTFHLISFFITICQTSK